MAQNVFGVHFPCDQFLNIAAPNRTRNEHYPSRPRRRALQCPQPFGSLGEFPNPYSIRLRSLNCHAEILNLLDSPGKGKLVPYCLIFTTFSGLFYLRFRIVRPWKNC